MVNSSYFRFDDDNKTKYIYIYKYNPGMALERGEWYFQQEAPYAKPFHFQPSMLVWAYTWAKIVFSQAAGRLYPKLCRIVLICSCAIRGPFAHFTLWACLWAKNCISETTGWVFSRSNFYRIILPCTCATARPFAHSPLWAWPWAKNYLWNRLTDFSPKFYRIV